MEFLYRHKSTIDDKEEILEFGSEVMVDRERIERECICGKTMIQKIGTVDHHIDNLKIELHNVPHYYCSQCERVAYDIDTDIMPLLKVAYKLRLKEVDWQNRNNMNIVFTFNAADDLKQEIQGIINENIDNIKDESFVIMLGSRVIVGQRIGSIIVVEKMIGKVI
ncbi:YgiT-type zinc finger protein [Brevibacillus sp. SIMBA_040]|uniref:YgiT-type zinc finger protein n=1 Tax=unclassified Brevibacillus TaxID=2684853 RepID=UPI0039787C51